VRGLASDGHGNALAIVGGNELCRRTAGGAWSKLAHGAEDLSASVAMGNDIYVGIDTRPCVMRLRPDQTSLEPLLAFEHVPGKETWYAGTAVVEGRVVGPPLGVRSMAATCNGVSLLANVHIGGIPRSTDGGATWLPTIDIHWDVHQVCAHATRPELMAAATAVGLALSRDGGETWTLHDRGLHATYCSAVAFAGDEVLVAASDHHFAPRGSVYRFETNGDALLARVTGGMPTWLEGIADTGNIAARGSEAAVVDQGGNLYASSDQGLTWTRLAGSLPYSSGLLIS
jgi:hypothetical protein